LLERIVFSIGQGLFETAKHGDSFVSGFISTIHLSEVNVTILHLAQVLRQRTPSYRLFDLVHTSLGISIDDLLENFFFPLGFLQLLQKVSFGRDFGRLRSQLRPCLVHAKGVVSI
jgi:hypothetical protein